jgi:hypothetical protein
MISKSWEQAKPKGQNWMSKNGLWSPMSEGDKPNSYNNNFIT